MQESDGQTFEYRFPALPMDGTTCLTTLLFPFILKIKKIPPPRQFACFDLGEVDLFVYPYKEI